MSGEVTSWPFHIIPMRDFREHTTDADCWCHPTLDDGEEYGTEKVFVHNSMDEREKYETGERLMS